MKKTVKQHDMNDCGAACIASVAAHYQLGLPIAVIRQYSSTDRQGTTVYGLIMAAEKLGFCAKGVRGTKEALRNIPMPAIAHVVRKMDDKELHHYVVIYRVTGKTVLFMDPNQGQMKNMPIDDFCSQWSGVLVLMEPSDAFEKGDHTIPFTKRFWELMGPHRFVLIQALVGAIVYTVLGLSTSIYIEKITDYVLVGGNTRLLNMLSIVMIVLLMLQLFIGVLQKVMVLRTGQLMDARLILGYYKHLLRLPQQFFDTMQIGEITSRIGDAVNIRNFINNVSITIVVNVFIVLFSFALMFTYYWKLALIMLAVIPIYIGIYFVTNRLNKKTERSVMERAAGLESQLVESLNAVRTVKQFGIEDYTNTKTENRFVQMMYTVYRSAKNGLFTGTSSELVNRLFTIVLLWIGSYYVLDTEITAGELMSFYALIGYFMSPIAQLIEANRSVQNAFIAADRLFEIMDLQQENSESETIETDRSKIGDIVFDNIDFSYGNRARILENFSMVLKQGSISAIVGESGSGKTTLASLLQNLYPISGGKITIGQYDLKYMNNAAIRSLVTTVPQQITLFAGTVAQNIALGEYEPDMDKILSIAKDLDMMEFIDKLPQGFATMVGENGALLSGGQKQRIAIARALYRNAEIIIMDEATSSLDSISEQSVQKAVCRLREQGKTIIIIAHRLSTIKNADKIFVLSEGKLVEEGKYDDLMSQKSSFYALWKSQYEGIPPF